MVKVYSVEDYAQESGRGGRDGQESEAVFLGPRSTLAPTTTSNWIATIMEPSIGPSIAPYTIEDLLSGSVCIRRVLDAVLDGNLGRAGCNKAEELLCSYCDQQARRGGLTAQGSSLIYRSPQLLQPQPQPQLQPQLQLQPQPQLQQRQQQQPQPATALPVSLPRRLPSNIRRIPGMRSLEITGLLQPAGKPIAEGFTSLQTSNRPEVIAQPLLSPIVTRNKPEIPSQPASIIATTSISKSTKHIKPVEEVASPTDSSKSRGLIKALSDNNEAERKADFYRREVLLLVSRRQVQVRILWLLVADFVADGCRLCKQKANIDSIEPSRHRNSISRPLDSEHLERYCTRPSRLDEAEKGLLRQAKELEKALITDSYTCCQECFFPQSICEAWEEIEGNSGAYERRPLVRCIRKGQLVDFLFLRLAKGQEKEVFNRAKGMLCHIKRPVGK